MRILVVGAGGVGGYFGGRLAEAGVDVTFLVRPARAARLAATGLVITSPRGDFHDPHPRLVDAAGLAGHAFDVVLLSCKAYDLAEAVASFAPAVGGETLVLPLLNGLGHLDALDERFRAERVLGGQCIISAALDPEGRVLHLNDVDVLTFGARTPVQQARAEAIASCFSSASFTSVLSPAVMQEMWEKWVFIAVLAGMTCLMRASIGDITAAGGGDLAGALLEECAAIAASHGHAPRAAVTQRARAAWAVPGSPLKASMLRDIEAGRPTEAEQILGDMVRRCPARQGAPVLRTALVHLRAYELARRRGV